MRVARKKKRILDLPISSRPREKLAVNGRENVSNAELLAILFGTGTKKENAVELGEQILKKFPLKELGKVDYASLIKITGIRQAKATRLLAALELGQRIYDNNKLTKILINSLEDTVRVIQEYADRKQEYLVCLYLNARHELLQKEIIGVGSLNSLQVEPREVFRPAFTTPCAGIIIAHNHPSGDSSPSEDDILFTKRIHEAGEIMGIPLLDHVIISSSGYFSFRENKTV